MNSIVSALRLLFLRTLDRPELARRLARMKRIRRLRIVLSQDEVARLLGATTCLKHQAALSVVYGAGLRAAEVAARKVRDVNSERMLPRVERGKGDSIATRCSRPACSRYLGSGEGRAAPRRDAP
jgi:integrase